MVNKQQAFHLLHGARNQQVMFQLHLKSQDKISAFESLLKCHVKKYKTVPTADVLY